MYVLVLMLPLLSFILSSTLGFFLGRYGATLLSVVFLGLTFLVSLLIFYEVGLCNLWSQVELFRWTILDVYVVQFGLLFDSVTVIMLLVITSISFFVHLYSLEYMSHDPFLNRFISYLSLFTFFMLILVTADNFIQLFIGWEGVGLCSYLLINFWYTRTLANKAALKAMIMNRIADVFFLIAIFFILYFWGTTNYQIVFSVLPYWTTAHFHFLNMVFLVPDFLGFFLFIGAIGKSAQLGLHTWLPDAMEGPTPVSALLHAATMVTAGVFLLIRCSPLFEFSSFSLSLLGLAGGLTAFFFSFCAVFQFDLKKVIAYSTCSQLGYMFLACSLSFYNIAFFHLFNHAFFKALLFLSAGSVIHALNDEQDMRRMGGLVNFLPFTFFCMLFGSLAIMGFPFLTGFYSKDLILEVFLSNYYVNSLFLYTLALLAAFFTAMYSMRLLFLVFFYKPNFYFVFSPQESSTYIVISLFVLALGSIYMGYIFSDLFVGWASLFWSNSLSNLPLNNLPCDIAFLSPLQRNLPLVLSSLGWLIGFLLITFHKKWGFIPGVSSSLEYYLLKFYVCLVYVMSSFFYYAGFFNTVYNKMFLDIYLFSYMVNTKIIDKGILELVGPVGVYRFFFSLSRGLWSINSSVFLNIGFMFFSLVFFYIYGICYEYTLVFFLGHYGILPLSFFIIYNEFYKGL